MKLEQRAALMEDLRKRLGFTREEEYTAPGFVLEKVTAEARDIMEEAEHLAPDNRDCDDLEVLGLFITMLAQSQRRKNRTKGVQG